jgi:hypothetical protein
MKGVTVLVLAMTALAAAQPPGHVRLTLVDDEAHGYATFQSHNQKVVANRYGIFMTHIRTRNEAYTAQQWRLSRSTDGGATFTTVYEATDATNPPVLETDDEGRIYLIRPDFIDGHAYLYRFSPAQDFRDPQITRIPGGAAGKYAAAVDPPSGKLYYIAYSNNTLYTLGLQGALRGSLQLTGDGPDAHMHYPLLCLSREGDLHAAWTTVRHGAYLYWDVHHVMSRDGGVTWRNMGGPPLATPVVADQHGPATRVTLDDEFDVHTWLSSFIVKEGKLHLLYLAQGEPHRQHYVRYDIATGRRDVHLQPHFRGKTLEIRTVDGFFATDSRGADGPLYCVGRDPSSRIVCLVTHDNAESWNDHAATAESFSAYSIGGCRQVMSDGSIIGSFTDVQGSTAVNDRMSRVYFLRIEGSARPQP